MKQAAIMSLIGLVSILAASSALAATAAEQIDPRQGADVAVEANAFAADLYAKLAAGKQGNLFFSPYSIHSALAMTYAGARGTTAQQMAATLHYAMPPERMHGAYAGLMRNLNTVPKLDDIEAYKLVVANALWGQKGYPFRPEFLTIARENYQAGLELLDFRTAAEPARLTINAWVEKQTQEKIKDLVPPGAISTDTRLVLTNAIYFKSNWAEKFAKKATKNEPFHVAAGKSVNVPMMRTQERFGYAEADGVKVLELPYMMHSLSMLVLLPEKADGLEKRLTAQNLGAWTRGLANRPVKVWLPRFKVTDQFKLADTLRAMGMAKAFDPKKADFSGMTLSTDEPLCISEVIHKAFVAVDEEGTEAVAATAVMMGVTAMPRPEEPVEFRADRPFIFIIRHNATGAVLFMGRVMDPSR